ncbi:MAG: flavodoxin family protein [Eggerthellaceae bacterium]
MKVLLVNGSPHKKGCVDAALGIIGRTLRQDDIDSEVFWLGKKPVGGCIDCKYCKKSGACVFDDVVNEFNDLARSFDGFVFGVPVYFSGVAGSMKSFMDRVFYSVPNNGEDTYAYKPAAIITSARRAGTTLTLATLNQYPLYAHMPLVPSRYWNMIHGNTPEEIMEDEEGVQIMEQIGHNMAWMLKSFAAGKAAGLELPKRPLPRKYTNFIR